MSRSYLPKILAKVDYGRYSSLVHARYGVELSKKEGRWFSLDGKELRGSILRGDKRGEAIVQAVSHEGRHVAGEGFYCGAKESEIPGIRDLLETAGVKNQKVTLDALHLNPGTLETINSAGGTYLAGLKGNQPELSGEMVFEAEVREPVHSRIDREKGHGRLERRTYECFDISGAALDKRWDDSGMRALVRVEREREITLTANKSLEVSYYLSNMAVSDAGKAAELFNAARNHWQVEVNNNMRDCTLAEDKLRCTDKKASRTTAACRTLVTKLLQKSEIKNKCAQMDEFADNFQVLLNWLRRIHFL